MITLDGVARQFGGEYLFRDVSFRIGDDERVALVGPNGAGKSTLMKILLGLVEPDYGTVSKSRSTTVGYLPQDGVIHGGRSLYDEAASAFEELLALHARVDGIAVEIETLRQAGRGESAEVHELVDEMGRIQHHLEHAEGYSIKTRVEQVLFGLGFRAADLGRPTEEFSGGWQMRLCLAKLLLSEPTLLMLDEPTNHLDIESLEWLEDYLKAYDGSVLLISHDRRFLDMVVNRTLELAAGKLTDYKGNYTWYLEQKAERLEILRAQYENQQERIKATLAFAERFRYKATKARQVQSRLRNLEKLDLVTLDEEEGAISFDFPAPPQPGRTLLTLKHVRKAYGDLEVLRNLSLTVERGDRIAFMGVNGAGKSTLARIVAGIEPFQSGARTEGHNVIISYYAQHQAEELDPGRTVLETLETVARNETTARLRTLLGCFLFRGDDVFKRVSVLSGGEKSRLALAKMLLTPANLLVLDEPTNHLDMRSKAVLREALENFGGSYVIVSHDRDFLETLVNKVAEFGESGVHLHLGTVEEWLERVHARKAAARQEAAGKKPRPSQAAVSPAPADTGVRPASSRGDRERRRQEARQRQESSRKQKPLQETIRKLEGRIAAAEGRKSEVESALADGATYADPEVARRLAHEFKEVTADLAYLYDDWTRLQEDLEAAAGQAGVRARSGRRE